jgi:ribonucleotide reductase beta subunit family protein with ferritin-like domain/intein/homing endonuclease
LFIIQSPPKMPEVEILLQEEPERLTIFPIKYQQLWDQYKAALSAIWTVEEINFSSDLDDWLNLSDNERFFIKNILAFFSSSDTIVNINLSERFINEVKPLEAKFFYAFQESMENIHCVSGDTEILTRNGYFPIETLLDQSVDVWNGKEFSNTMVKYTGDSNLIRVKLSNGMTLDCTPNHRWFMRCGNQLHPEQCKKEIVYTKDLKLGDVVHKYELPVMEMTDPDEFKNPYIHGFFCGDGSYVKHYPRIVLYDEKMKLIEFFKPETATYRERTIGFYITNKINKPKFFVPINYSIQTKISWLEGICDADGCINYNRKRTSTSIQIGSINFDFLKDIQLMLSTIGVHTNITKNRDEQQNWLPRNDGSGDYGYYPCQPLYVLYITCADVSKLVELGFTPKRLKLKTSDTLIDKKKLIKIVSLEELEGIHKTYCFTEPKEHAGIFNGILTGQSECYSLLIDTYIKDQKEKHETLNAIKYIPCIARKADWCFKWINDHESPFAQRLIAFAIVEGVFFSGAFCSIFWLKERGKMPGLCFSNELISRDESMHVNFATTLYSMIKNRLPQEVVHNMFTEAVEVEKNFIIESIPCALLGMNSQLMSTYIEFVADRLLVQLDYEKLFNVHNPFPFMERISIETKSNFFENRVAEYSKANVGTKVDHSKIHEFTLDEDF